MNLKVKHQITENTLRGEVTPETKSGVTDWLFKVNLVVAVSCIVASIATCWSTVAVKRLLVLVATVVRRVVLLFGCLQVHARLVGFHSLDGSSLNSPACHEVEFSLGTKVLKVFARIKEDVHLFYIILRKLFQRSSWFTSDGDAEDTQLAKLNLVAHQQLFHEARASIAHHSLHRTTGEHSVVVGDVLYELIEGQHLSHLVLGISHFHCVLLQRTLPHENRVIYHSFAHRRYGTSYLHRPGLRPTGS